MAETPNSTGTPGTPGSASVSLRTDFWRFVLMLILAIGGVAISQLEDSGGKRYWTFLVLVYAGISLVRTWLPARHSGSPVWPMLRAQVLHWAGTLVAINIVLLFEVSGVSDRGPASDTSLLLLALSCYLAGVHFNWTFLILGLVLAVIAIGLGYLDQLSVFALIVPVAAVGLWLAFKRLWAPAS